MRLLKSDGLSYKVNRNMLRISVVRLRGRIEGAALVTFISLVRFRNQLVNKKILNSLHSRRAVSCSSGVCTCDRMPLSDKPGHETPLVACCFLQGEEPVE